MMKTAIFGCGGSISTLEKSSKKKKSFWAGRTVWCEGTKNDLFGLLYILSVFFFFNPQIENKKVYLIGFSSSWKRIEIVPKEIPRKHPLR